MQPIIGIFCLNIRTLCIVLLFCKMHDILQLCRIYYTSLTFGALSISCRFCPEPEDGARLTQYSDRFHNASPIRLVSTHAVSLGRHFRNQNTKQCFDCGKPAVLRVGDVYELMSWFDTNHQTLRKKLHMMSKKC